MKYFKIAITLFSIITISSCNSKHEYPPDVTQNFMNSCQENGGSQGMCSCVLEQIQKKYTIEEFSTIEVKIKAGQSTEDFMDFVGKARVECNQK